MNKIKAKAAFKQQISEVIFLLQTVNEKVDVEEFNSSKYEVQESILRRVHGGETTSQFAYFQFLKAKRMMMSGMPPEETLQCINKAIEI